MYDWYAIVQWVFLLQETTVALAGLAAFSTAATALNSYREAADVTDRLLACLESAVRLFLPHFCVLPCTNSSAKTRWVNGSTLVAMPEIPSETGRVWHSGTLPLQTLRARIFSPLGPSTTPLHRTSPTWGSLCVPLAVP